MQCLNSAVPTEPCMGEIQCALTAAAKSTHELNILFSEILVTMTVCYHSMLVVTGGVFQVNTVFTHSSNAHVNVKRAQAQLLIKY